MKKFLPKSSVNPKGFTLIELLIVISIIAVLATIGFAVYSGLGVQAKSRNAARRADLDAISKALEVNKYVGQGNYLVLSASQFSNGAIPTKDPQSNEYCANTVASAQPADPSAPLPWGATCSLITTPASAAGYSTVGTTYPPTGTAWKICTYLEAEVNPAKAATVFCKLSAQ